MVGEKYTGRLRENFQKRKANWKNTLSEARAHSVFGAMGSYLRGVGEADRHLLHRGR